MKHIKEILKEMDAEEKIRHLMATVNHSPSISSTTSPPGNLNGIPIAKSEKEIWREKIIPPAYRHCSFSTFEGKPELLDPLKAYASNWPPGNLLISGPCGSGKTHLAVAILQNQINLGRWLYVWLVSAPDLLMEIRNSYQKDSRMSEADMIEKYTDDFDFLVIDDLGAEYVTDWAISIFYRILDERFRQGIPTLITTNLTIEEIEQRFGSRVASRLSQYSQVRLEGDDYRKKRQDNLEM